MSEINLYQSGSDDQPESFLAHVPGTSAHARRRDDLARQRRHEIEVNETAHEAALERQRIAADAVNSRFAMQAAGAVGEAALQAARAMGDAADAGYQASSPAGQTFIVSTANVLGSAFDEVASSHMRSFRK